MITLKPKRQINYIVYLIIYQFNREININPYQYCHKIKQSHPHWNFPFPRQTNRPRNWFKHDKPYSYHRAKHWLMKILLYSRQISRLYKCAVYIVKTKQVLIISLLKQHQVAPFLFHPMKLIFKQLWTCMENWQVDVKCATIL